MESEKASNWLEQFFSDTGLRWWPFMSRRASRFADRLPKTASAFSGENGSSEVDDVGGLSDENDSFWSAQVRSIRLLTKTKSGVPDIVLSLPTEDLAQESELTPRLADIGRLVLGRLFREIQRGSRPMVEKLERISDLDEGWIDGLGQLFGYLVMAKYLNVDREAATGSTQVVLTKRWREMLNGAALLQTEERSRESSGREVLERQHHLLRNSEVLGKLASMVDNRDEVLLRRYLEAHGHPGMSFDGRSHGHHMSATTAREISERLGLTGWNLLYDTIRGASGDLLLRAAYDEAAFEAAVSTAGAALPDGARTFFQLSGRFLSNRNRAIHLYKELRHSKISLTEFDFGASDHDEEASVEADNSGNDASGNQEIAALLPAAPQETDFPGPRVVTYESSHQTQILMALRRLESPDLQLLWSLVRCRVAWTLTTDDTSYVERDWVYAAASNAMRALLGLGAQDAIELRRLLAAESDRLHKGHATFHPAGDQSKLFVETVNSALAWFRARGVTASAFTQFDLDLNNAGGYKLTPKSRREIAKWRHSLVERCRADWPLKLYLLPALNAEAD